MDNAAFRRQYTHRVGKRGISLKDRGRKEQYYCVFFEHGTGCTLYEQRPKQCRTWPFWRSVIDSEESWQDESPGCPGLNTGKHYSAETIQAIAADDGLP